MLLCLKCQGTLPGAWNFRTGSTYRYEGAPMNIILILLRIIHIASRASLSDERLRDAYHSHHDVGRTIRVEERLGLRIRVGTGYDGESGKNRLSFPLAWRSNASTRSMVTSESGKPARASEAVIRCARISRSTAPDARTRIVAPRGV